MKERFEEIIDLLDDLAFEISYDEVQDALFRAMDEVEEALEIYEDLLDYEKSLELENDEEEEKFVTGYWRYIRTSNLENDEEEEE